MPVWSIRVSLGYPVTVGLGDGSDPLEGHSRSSRWDFEGVAGCVVSSLKFNGRFLKKA